MSLRSKLAEDLKSAMKAGDAARLSTIRMMIARQKEVDIAARPRGVAQVGDPELIGAFRAMAKSRGEAVALYRQGGREELAEKEEAEIRVIESYLPARLEGEALRALVERAIAETGATGRADMGRVMASLKASHGTALDMAAAGALVRERLA